MNRKACILVVIFTIAAFGAGLFWYASKKTVAPIIPTPTPVVTPEPTPTPTYVTDVDPDVSHWQTKETKFFTIKFPKEWYWIEMPGDKPGAQGNHVISNNQSFPLTDYENDSVSMTGVNPEGFTNTEVVITDWGTPTSNSGTPLDSLDHVFRMARGADSTAECQRLTSTKQSPLYAFCKIKLGNHKMGQEFYYIDNAWTLVVTAWTTDDTLVSRDVLEKITRSIHIKY